MSPESSVAIVVVNFGSVSLLAANLAPLAEECPWASVVVVDNYCSDLERRQVAELAVERGWTLECPVENLGFGRGMNLGVARAFAGGASVAVMLNPDAVITGEQLEALVDRHEATPGALLSPVIVRPDGRPWFSGAIVDLHNGHLRSGVPSSDDELPWLSGACLVAGRETWELIGGFDDEYFLYWEDVDLSVRALRAGIALVVADDIVITHDEGGTQRDGSAAGPLSDTYYFYNIRNRILFARKNLSKAQRRGWARHTISESYEILLRGSGRRIFLRPWRPAVLAARGIWSGHTSRCQGSPAHRQEVGRSEPPRVLVVHPSSELYGSDRVLADAVSAMTEQRWAVSVALPEQGALNAALVDRGASVHIVRTPVLRKNLLTPAGFLRFVADTIRGTASGLQLLRSVDPEVVYVSTVTIPLWLVLSRLCRRTVVCHVHEAERGASAVLRFAMALPLLLADEIVLNSEFSQSVLLESIPRLGDRCEVIPNPVPGPTTVVPARSSVEGDLRVLYMGRLSPRKGPDLVVAAAAILNERNIAVHVDLLGSVFAGYEWFEADLRRRAAESLMPGQVDFLGFQPDIWPVLAAADIVVIPSVMPEPFGNTAVEAVLGARPVVVSASGGLVEAVAGFDCAMVVPVGDPAGIADAVAAIVEDWPTFSSAALSDARIAEQRHSAELFGERLRSVIRRASIRRPRPRVR